MHVLAAAQHHQCTIEWHSDNSTSRQFTCPLRGVKHCPLQLLLFQSQATQVMFLPLFVHVKYLLLSCVQVVDGVLSQAQQMASGFTGQTRMGSALQGMVGGSLGQSLTNLGGKINKFNALYAKQMTG